MIFQCHDMTYGLGYRADVLTNSVSCWEHNCLFLLLTVSMTVYFHHEFTFEKLIDEIIYFYSYFDCDCIICL